MVVNHLSYVNNQKLIEEYINMVDRINADIFCTLTLKHKQSDTMLDNNLKHLVKSLNQSLYGSKSKNSDIGITGFAFYEKSGVYSINSKHIHALLKADGDTKIPLAEALEAVCLNMNTFGVYDIQPIYYPRGVATYATKGIKYPSDTDNIKIISQSRANRLV